MRFHGKRAFIAACALAALIVAQGARAAEPETFGIPNATFPEPGLMAAGQPTGEQVQLLAEEGYKTILDLRAVEEPRGFAEAEAARQNGLAYTNLPVTSATLDQATIDRFLEAMRKAERPVLLHCAGSVRVGALYYAWLTLEQGVPAAEAMARAKAAGARPEWAAKVEELVRERQKPRK